MAFKALKEVQKDLDREKQKNQKLSKATAKKLAFLANVPAEDAEALNRILLQALRKDKTKGLIRTTNILSTG